MIGLDSKSSSNIVYAALFLLSVASISNSFAEQNVSIPAQQENLLEKSKPQKDASQINKDIQKLLFVSNQDGDREIFISNMSGSFLKQLTFNNRDEYDASWSPDGQYILFSSNRDNGNAEIYKMNADGSKQINLSNSAGYDGQAIWSPDGESIVFNSDRNGGAIGLYIMSSTGKNITQLSQDDKGNYSFPSWSPNGKWIAYRKQLDSDKADLWLVDSEGKQHKQLTKNSKYSDGEVSWSPDNNKLLYHSRRNREYNIYLYDLQSNKERQLTNLPTSDSKPKWSNQGGDIVFISTRGSAGRTQLFIMKEDGSQQQSITDGRFQANDAMWLEDDSGLLYVSWQQGGVSNVFLADLNTGKQMIVSPAKGYQSQPLPEPAVLPKHLSNSIKLIASIDRQ